MFRCVPLKQMVAWVPQVLGFLSAGSASGWWGLLCPAHCTGSLSVLTLAFVSGLGVGALLTLFLFRRTLFVAPPSWPSCPSGIGAGDTSTSSPASVTRRPNVYPRLRALRKALLTFKRSLRPLNNCILLPGPLYKPSRAVCLKTAGNWSSLQHHLLQPALSHYPKPLVVLVLPLTLCLLSAGIFVLPWLLQSGPLAPREPGPQAFPPVKSFEESWIAWSLPQIFRSDQGFTWFSEILAWEGVVFTRALGPLNWPSGGCRTTRCHGFPTEGECRVYCRAAGVDFPPEEP